MQHTLLSLMELLSPLMLAAALKCIRHERSMRNLTLRMLPPEHRPAKPKHKISLLGPGCNSDERDRHLHLLWTLKDCQMELLTESRMHAFEAEGKAYVPDRIASNLPPHGIPWRVAAARARESSILLRTLERDKSLVPADSAANYGAKPEIEEHDGNVLLYLHQELPAQIRANVTTG